MRDAYGCRTDADDDYLIERGARTEPCARPECTRRFINWTGRQLFCSRRCGLLVAKRSSRDRERAARS